MGIERRGGEGAARLGRGGTTESDGEVSAKQVKGDASEGVARRGSGGAMGMGRRDGEGPARKGAAQCGNGG